MNVNSKIIRHHLYRIILALQMEPKIPSEKIVRKVMSSVRNALKEAMKGQIVLKIIFVEDVEMMVI